MGCETTKSSQGYYESPLLTACRVYGIESEEFETVMNSMGPHEHAEAIRRTIEGPLFNVHESELLTSAVEALTQSVRRKANLAEQLAACLSVDARPE